MASDQDHERAAIEGVVTRLSAMFAGTHTPEQVETAVMKAYGKFADSPVRDFIPVLVEHDSKEILRGDVA
ncbi:three-helix bundle dimerization domain-containing protein [Nonomuraea sp. SYSU D8015]|uniref:three-helix bundle dimerization domain-containing protein n=1 Tax=Nonomuraea sp. SYSU D8015 TaxID=2593644 RepID=UPI0016600A20|nr:hypothetical protein [Nonomuraea sp. SYSU D8015]